jgi:AcrR family transcriptional regulator
MSKHSPIKVGNHSQEIAMAKDAKELWREQLAEVRRRQIIEAAASVFAAKGFHNTTTKEIAEAAGVSEGTIYNYFSSKEDLLLGMLNTFITESIQSILDRSPSDDPKAVLAAVYRDRLALLERRGALIHALFPQIFTNEQLRHQFLSKTIQPLIRRIEEQITAQTERGLFRPVNAAIATRAMMGFLIVYVVLGLAGKDPVLVNTPHDELVEEVVSLFIDGLRVRPGESEQETDAK